MTKKDFILAYLKNGISVFPTKGKKPLVSWERYQKERPTEQQVIDWWTKWLDADIAGVTGEISGIVVVDVDGGEVPPLPPTAVSETSPGHYQYFFKHPGFPVQNSIKVIAPNVDIKADGGYVILPPSRHFNKQSGKQDFTYRWSISPKEAGFAELPVHILEKIKSKKLVANIVHGVPEGERNNSATSMVGKLLKRFPEEEWESEVWPLLQSWNEDNKPPLPEDELRSVFDSISQRETDNKENRGDLADDDGKRSVADKLVDLVLASDTELYIDQTGEPHITFPEKPVVGFPIKSSVLRRWLAGKYWQETNKGFSGETFLQVVNGLEGKAFYEGETKTLFNRVARQGNTIFYDLGDDNKVVKITPQGWEVTTNCPLRFRRFSHQLPQVMPVQGGRLEDVVKYVNLKTETDRLLFLTYLITVFIPDIPRVVLINIGDQGAAKSTAMRIARSLVDPSISELLSPPRDITELAQASNHHYCLYLDNLSYLKDEISDVLCRLATGIGFTKRKLFTNDEDVLFNQKIAVGITGINLVAQRADLLDRCLILSFERIPEEKRLDEEDFWKNFNTEKPYILGALFTTLSKTLQIISNFKLSKKPRMADYAKYAAAGAIALGRTSDEFLSAFSENIGRQNQAAIESSPTAQAIIEFMLLQDEWSGSSSDLHKELIRIVEKANLQLGGKDGFPKSSNWLWKRIMQVRPNLLSLGINVTKSESEISSIITLKKSSKDSENTAITSNTANGQKDMAAMAVNLPQAEESESQTLLSSLPGLEEYGH